MAFRGSTELEGLGCAGAGIVYSRTAENNFQSYAVGANLPYSAPGFGDPAYLLQNGLPYKVMFPNFDPGQQPYLGIPAGTLNYFDRNGGRPARLLQWSIGLQRELSHNIVVEASYVGNRGVWWQCNGCISDNGVTGDYLKARGIDINNPTDVTLLSSPITSPQAIARGFTKLTLSNELKSPHRNGRRAGLLRQWHWLATWPARSSLSHLDALASARARRCR